MFDVNNGIVIPLEWMERSDLSLEEYLNMTSLADLYIKRNREKPSIRIVLEIVNGSNIDVMADHNDKSTKTG